MRNGYRSQRASRRITALNYIPKMLGEVVRANPWVAMSLALVTVVLGVLTPTQFRLLGGLAEQLDRLGGVGAAGWGVMRPWLLLFAATIVLEAVLQAVSPILETALREALGIRTQKQVIEKAQSLDLVYFEHPEFYDSLQRANQDMSGRLVTLLRLVLDVARTGIEITSFIAMLLFAHWALVPMVLIGSIPSVLVSLRMNRRTYWVYRMRTPENRMANYLRDLLIRRDAAKEVRLFTLSSHLMGKWTGLSTRLAGERRGLEVKQSILGGMGEGVSSLAYAGSITLLAYMILGQRIGFATYVTLSRSLLSLANGFESVMRSAASLQEQSLYLGDLYEFLNLDPSSFGDEKGRRVENEAHPAGPSERGSTSVASLEDQMRTAPHVALPSGQGRAVSQLDVGDEPLGEIVFENVSFRYPGSDRLVLRNLNLVIRPSERVALVGENGAGKSTLVRLLLGLYRPTSGRILLGGRELYRLPQEYVRSRMAAVFQDYVKYLFTVHDNIALGRLNAVGESQVVRAAEMAGIAPYIESLPDRYQTQLGREMGGMDFSGGEWQKLAIARALVREAELIILDEPTAALDPLAEAEIYQRFLEMTRGRTAVMISHRLGSARMAHRIVFLKDGSVAEEGDHDSLVALGGEYARLFALQAQWYE